MGAVLSRIISLNIQRKYANTGNDVCVTRLINVTTDIYVNWVYGAFCIAVIFCRGKSDDRERIKEKPLPAGINSGYADIERREK
jgi:hypothetical protein